MQVRSSSRTRTGMACGGEGVEANAVKTADSGGYIAVSECPGRSRGGPKNAPGLNIMLLMSLMYSHLYTHHPQLYSHCTTSSTDLSLGELRVPTKGVKLTFTPTVHSADVSTLKLPSPRNAA